MSISNTVTRTDYAGNGSTTTFAIVFDFQANSEVRVVLRDINDVETLQVITTDYTLTGGTPPVNVEMIVAPATGEVLVVKRQTLKTQATDYVGTGPFPAESHEDALDKLTQLTQEVCEKLTRTPLLPETEQQIDPIFPEGGTANANKVIAYNASGTNLKLFTAAELLTLVVSSDLDVLLDAKSATIVNNQVGAANVSGWTIDAVSFTSAWYMVEYLRPADTDLISNGIVWLQRVEGAWRIDPLIFSSLDLDGGIPAGVTLSVTEAAGIAQVQYTTTDLTGGLDGTLKFKKIPFAI